MTNLITAAEFATYRNVSQKLDEGKINEAISLAQQSDLIEILGDFYFDVVANVDEDDWSDLLSGSAFTFEDQNYQHAGIKSMLADYAYARFVYMVNINATPFGFQQKYTEDSNGIDRNTIKDLAKQAQADAGIKFKFIELYLQTEPELFSRFDKNKRGDTPFFTQRISIL